MRAGRQDFMTELGSGAVWADLDPREFERFRRLVSASGRRAEASLAGLADRELAVALGVASAQGALLPEALLLFGRPEAIRWHLPFHEVAMQVLRGEVAEVNDFFHWPLFRLAEELLARFRARTATQAVRYELVRVQVPACSEQAFRELLTNALTHRDYTVPGVVHVRWGEDGIQIANPARLGVDPRPGTALSGLPVARNPLLVDAFRRAGIAQRTGRGVGRAIAEQLRHGLAAPRFERSTDRAVIALLPGDDPDLAFARYVVAREHLGQPLGRAHLQLLTALIHRHRLRTAEAAALLTTDRSHARATLFGLLRAGLVQVSGDSAGRTWQLTDQVRRDLRDSAAHVRDQLTGRTGPATPAPATPAPAAHGPAGPHASAGWAIPDAGPALPPARRASGRP